MRVPYIPSPAEHLDINSLGGRDYLSFPHHIPRGSRQEAFNKVSELGFIFTIVFEDWPLKGSVYGQLSLSFPVFKAQSLFPSFYYFLPLPALPPSNRSPLGRLPVIAHLPQLAGFWEGGFNWFQVF